MPLPWFRRKKSEDAARLEPADAAPAVEVTTVATLAEAGADGAESTTDAAPRKRRRGTRGGRNRKKTGTAAATAVADTPAETEKEKKGPERKRATQPRRRTPPKRAPLPKAKRELVVSVDAGEKRVAVLEDDKVAEVYLERPERRSIAGNIYLGVVGAGFGFRAVARELLDFVPVAGWALKASVAFAGTKAIGEAAVRYFEARR